jgi:hypothetical protein
MDDLEEQLISMISSAETQGIPITKFRNYINQMFIDEVKKRNQESPREGLHASDLLANMKGKYRFCYRQHTLGHFYKPVETKELTTYSFFDIKMMRIQKMGWYVHLMFQRLWREFGHPIAIEKTHYNRRYDLYYTPDIEAQFPSFGENKKYVVEIKSMNTNNYEKAVVCESALEGHESAYKQCQVYMMLLGYPKGLILVYDKDKSNFHVWEIDYDPEFCKPYKERLENLIRLYPIYEDSDGSDAHLARQVCDGPDAPRAKVCPMRNVCWLANKAERAPYLRGKMKNQQQQNVSIIHEDIAIDNSEAS